MSIFGRRPATSRDTGVGRAQNGWLRGSRMGSTPYHAWSYLYGARIGNEDATAATAEIAIYQVASGVFTTRIGVSGEFTVSGRMLPNDATTGSDHSKVPAAPIQRFANVEYGLAVRAEVADICFGQDNSGWVMHKRNGVSSTPDPYGATSAVPEGKMSLWLEEKANTKPKLPSNVSPVDGGQVTSGNPTLAADFRDDEEALPGFAIGTADKVKSYRFRVLNTAKTSVLKDSGVTASDATMKSNRRATWAVPSTALPAATYVAQCTLYDLFDTPSDTVEWTFTVNAGGSVTPELAPADVVDPAITNSDTPNLKLTWSHASALAMTHWEGQIRQESTDTIVRASAVTAALSLADGANGTVTGVFAGESWAALTKGLRYRYEVRGRDSTVVWSPWGVSDWFRVNAQPNMPDFLSPFNDAHVNIPTLEGRFTDPDDDSSTLTAAFFVRPSGDVTAGTAVAGNTYQGEDRWAVTPSSSVITGTGTWEWRAVALDNHGFLSGPYSAWQSFLMTTAPTIVITAPTNGATITTGTPTVTWTVDRTQTTFRLRVYQGSLAAWLLTELLGGSHSGTPLIYDSVTLIHSGGAHAIPAAKLRNDTEYVIVLDVTTSDGLTTPQYSGFTLEYIPEDAVAGLTAVASAGEFETFAAEYSEITAAWTAITTEIDDSEWGGYVVRRTDNGTMLVDAEWRLATKTENSLLDRTPRSGTSYTYAVTYLYLVNDLEWIESDEATAAQTVILRNTVISDLAPGGISVPIRYWSSRNADHVIDTETIPTWGRAPIIFQGLGDYQRIEFDFELLDDEYLGYTANDIMQALREIKAVTTDDDGRPVPRTLAYRDPKARLLYVSMVDLSEDDQHPVDRIYGSLGLVENATQGGT